METLVRQAPVPVVDLGFHRRVQTQLCPEAVNVSVCVGVSTRVGQAPVGVTVGDLARWWSEGKSVAEGEHEVVHRPVPAEGAADAAGRDGAVAVDVPSLDAADARYRSLIAASSLGKFPLFLRVLRSWKFMLSMAFVV
ncbi:hypothetical protein [Streptomyces sp. NBC_01210]|uniref:hypothetical protein n=1 Tax=Streptomyces sp. NBC_01210 TaxID=2903774 RepID=UPI003FA38AA8